jgi:hypothetical protein
MTVESEEPDKLEVEEVNEKAMTVTISYGSFRRMKFGYKNGKVDLLRFKPPDDSLDDPDHIPPMYFYPSIRRARAILSSRKKRN